MEITTKYSIGDKVYFLVRKRVSHKCSTCEGIGRINVTKGILRWNIECPDCKGKKSFSQTIRYEVASDIISGVVAERRENSENTRYMLENGMHKKETDVFKSLEEAEQRCKAKNEQVEQSRTDI